MASVGAMFDPSPALSARLTVVLVTHDCAHRLDEILDRLLDLNVPVGRGRQRVRPGVFRYTHPAKGPE